MKSVFFVLCLLLMLANHLPAYNPALLKKQTAQPKKELSESEDLFLHGKYPELAEHLKKLKEEGKLTPEAELMGCRLLIVIGQYAEAQKNLDELVKNNPENWAARMLLFDIYQITGKKRAIRLQQRFFRKCLAVTETENCPGFYCCR